MRQIVGELVEDVFGFEGPEELELEPFISVLRELQNFGYGIRKDGGSRVLPRKWLTERIS